MDDPVLVADAEDGVRIEVQGVPGVEGVAIAADGVDPVKPHLFNAEPSADSGEHITSRNTVRDRNAFVVENCLAGRIEHWPAVCGDGERHAAELFYLGAVRYGQGGNRGIAGAGITDGSRVGCGGRSRADDIGRPVGGCGCVGIHGWWRGACGQCDGKARGKNGAEHILPSHVRSLGAAPACADAQQMS